MKVWTEAAKSQAMAEEIDCSKSGDGCAFYLKRQCPMKSSVLPSLERPPTTAAEFKSLSGRRFVFQKLRFWQTCHRRLRSRARADGPERVTPAHRRVRVLAPKHLPARRSTRRRSAVAVGFQPMIAFTSRNASMPNTPHSRPLPDCLYPLNGADGVWGAPLMNSRPAFI